MEKLNQANTVAESEIPSDIITMNSKVKLINLSTNKEKIVTLIYHFDIGIEDGNVSILSPLGTSLLGQKVPALINSLVAEEDSIEIGFKLTEMVYQPEATGDWYK